LVHRDVKPANVLVEREQDGSAHAWLTDFGLTKSVGSKSGLTRTSVYAGTVDYAAPEQLEGGAVDARADGIRRVAGSRSGRAPLIDDMSAARRPSISVVLATYRCQAWA
jgi:serine/threonine protein kinase